MQNLYDVVVVLEAEGRPIDRREYKLALRTVKLRQEDDEWGTSFTFIVNGVPIFAKGSNWIPADSFVTRTSDEHLKKLITDAAASHQNMLRVWGGGLYGEERFYELCDKYGVLVWQDFLFSCSIFPLDEPSFHENVRIEVEENMKRLRHRASLALWCGNNEMEWFWETRGWPSSTATPRTGPVRHRRTRRSATLTASAGAMPTSGTCGTAARPSVRTTKVLRGS